MISHRSPASMLVVLPNWLGDVVMAAGLVADLDAARRDLDRPFELHVSVRRRWAPLVEGDPRLAGVHRYERTGRHAGVAGLGRLASDWRRGRFDAVVLCPPSLRVALAAWLAGIARRIGAASDGRRVLLTDPVAMPRTRGARHHADELRSLAGPLLATGAGGNSAAATGSATWPVLRTIAPSTIPDGPGVWVLAPGATFGSAKVWPVENQARWLELVVRQRRRRVVVVGDRQGRPLVDELRRRTSGLAWSETMGEEPGVVDLTDRTSLVELIAWLRAAEAFLGNDSGVMHLAAMLGVPTLGLFGSSSVAWTAPRGPRARAVAATGFACQPCFRRECNQPQFCLETIASEDALAALEDLIASRSEGAET